MKPPDPGAAPPPELLWFGRGSRSRIARWRAPTGGRQPRRHQTLAQLVAHWGADRCLLPCRQARPSIRIPAFERHSRMAADGYRTRRRVASRLPGRTRHLHRCLSGQHHHSWIAVDFLGIAAGNTLEALTGHSLSISTQTDERRLIELATSCRFRCSQVWSALRSVRRSA